MADAVLDRYNALPTLRQKQIDWLLTHGVPASALACDPPVIGTVIPRNDGTFDFCDESRTEAPTEQAVLFVSLEPDGTATDLVAWCPQSRRLGTWLGRAALLGDPAGPRLDPAGALPLWRSPLDWLRNNRDGVVIVDIARAARALIDLGPLLAETSHHAAEIHAAFEMMRPAILMHQQAEAA